MRALSFTLLVALFIAWASVAQAETLRCGNSLMEEGATATEVLGKCGEPQMRSEISEPIRARRQNGSTYVVGTTTRELWRYDFGSRKFPAVLTFEQGVLKKIEFEK